MALPCHAECLCWLVSAPSRFLRVLAARRSPIPMRGFYAESAREMVESGDWLTPHFNYVDRFEKPILYYYMAWRPVPMSSSGSERPPPVSRRHSPVSGLVS